MRARKLAEELYLLGQLAIEIPKPRAFEDALQIVVSIIIKHLDQPAIDVRAAAAEIRKYFQDHFVIPSEEVLISLISTHLSASHGEGDGHHLPNWLWCERCQAWIETEHACGAYLPPEELEARASADYERRHSEQMRAAIEKVKAMRDGWHEGYIAAGSTDRQALVRKELLFSKCHAANEIITALESLSNTSDGLRDWQPIETCPFATHVLLLWEGGTPKPHYEIVIGVVPVTPEFTREQWWNGQRGEYESMKPIVGWQPLPVITALEEMEGETK